MELAHFHTTNPDPERPGLCSNTGQTVDGCLFPGVEVLVGSTCFIGRPSLYEAIADMHQMTVAEVENRLDAEGSKQLQEIKRLKAEIKRLNGRDSAFQSFMDGLEKAGYVVPSLS